MAPQNNARPALYPLIAGAISHLENEKNRILSESLVLDRDISGFDDDYFCSLVSSMTRTASWCRPDFRAQWARNIPPFETTPNVDSTNRPSQVSFVLGLSDPDTDTASTDMIPESVSAPADPRLSHNNRPAL